MQRANRGRLLGIEPPQLEFAMKTMVGLTFVAVLAAAAVVKADSASAAEIRPGKPAPDFSVQDSNGVTQKLSDYRGRTVVLEWNNFECPYVLKHYGTGNMQALQAEATKGGAAWFVVNSAPRGRGGHLEGLEANKELEDRSSKPTAYLIDDKSSIGRLYGARNTPQMVVIDKDGQVAYIGAIDDRPTANRSDVKGARNYVREAVNSLAEGKPIQVSSTRPYGCSVKY